MLPVDHEAAVHDDPTDPQGPDDEMYPPYVQSAQERRRWRLAEGIASEIFGDAGEAHVWMATRSIYRSEIET